VDTLVPESERANHRIQRELYRDEPELAQTLMARRTLYGCSKDGSELPVEVSLSHLALDGADHVLVTVSDITERSLSEALLRAGERRLRLALDAARAGTWEWFVDSDNHFWSDELWSLYGLSEDDASASTETWWQTIHPDDLGRVQAAVKDARDLGLPFETEWRVPQPAGAPPRWLLCRGQPVVDKREQVISYIGIVLDVTGQRVAEEKRREGEALLATILDNVGACIYIKDLDYRYLYVNRAMASVFGAPREQICGQRDEAFCDPATVRAWRGNDRRVLEGASASSSRRSPSTARAARCTATSRSSSRCAARTAASTPCAASPPTSPKRNAPSASWPATASSSRAWWRPAPASWPWPRTPPRAPAAPRAPSWPT
jgi:PAS domain S-box-containing protein